MKEASRRLKHIIHVDEDYSPSHAGITAQVSQLTRYLSSRDCPTTILTVGAGDTLAATGVKVVTFPLSNWGRKWRYPVGMKTYLENLEIQGTVFHIHGIWSAPSLIMGWAAKKRRVPTLLTLHGMMKPWFWQQDVSHLLSYTAYWRMIAYPIFRYLPLIHAITEEERDHLSSYFSGQRIEVIPNAINLDEVDNCFNTPYMASSQGEKRRYLLFLGQIHPIKGIDILIRAFHQASKNKDISLLIVGQGKSVKYTQKLNNLVDKLGLSSRVIFHKAVYGPQKYQLFKDAWAVCLPSYSEVIGMTNLEAAAVCTPVITTYETGLRNWEDCGGVLVHPRIDELSRALEEVFMWSEKERNERGRNLRSLVERRYSWEAVGPLWHTLYTDMLEKYG